MIRAILLAFVIGTVCGWFARGVWEESAEADRLRAQVRAQHQDTKQQAKAEKHEQDQQRHDAGVSQKASDTAQKVAGWDSCPHIPAEYSRLLNTIGTASPSKLAGEVRGEAGTAGN